MSLNVMDDEASNTFIWTIENFSFCPQNMGERLHSPTFTVDEDDWYIRLYPGGVKQDNVIGCFLMRKELKEPYETISADYEYEFLNVEGTVSANVAKAQCQFPKDGFWGRGVQDYTKKAKYLPLDTLIVRCKMWIKDRKLLKSEVHRARTRFGIERGSFTWSVDWNRILLKERVSVLLTSASNKISPSKLALYMDDSELHLEVTQLNAKYQNVFISEIYVTVGKIQSELFAKVKHIFEALKDEQVIPFNLLKTKEDFILKDAYCPEGILILRCDVVMSSGSAINEVQSVGSDLLPNVCIDPPTVVPDFDLKVKTHRALVDDIQCLFKDGLLSDVTVSAGGETFLVHKLILGARSPVFQAMFCTPMKEKTSDHVEISDLDADTVRHMLDFFYSDLVENVQWEQMSQLYVAADKYQVLSLKEKCSEMLKDKLCASNACDLLVLADQHQDNYLKTYACDFIFEHDSEILKMDTWNGLQKCNPQLAFETWQYIYFKLKNLQI